MAASDADFLFELENDEGLWADSSQQGPFSRADIESYIANAPANELNGDVRLIICLDNRAIGTLDLFNYTPATPCAEVGIALVKDMRGHGYALQALCQAEEIAKKILQAHHLYAHVSLEHNPAARQLFERAGYEHVATLPNWHLRAQNWEDLAVYQKIL